jgi:hypothetical protein
LSSRPTTALHIGALPGVLATLRLGRLCPSSTYCDTLGRDILSDDVRKSLVDPLCVGYDAAHLLAPLFVYNV